MLIVSPMLEAGPPSFPALVMIMILTMVISHIFLYFIRSVGLLDMTRSPACGTYTLQTFAIGLSVRVIIMSILAKADLNMKEGPSALDCSHRPRYGPSPGS